MRRTLAMRISAALVLGSAIGAGLAFGVFDVGASSTNDVQAIQTVVNEANNFMMNQAAPQPPGASGPNWALSSDDPEGGFTSFTDIKSDTALSIPEHNWLVDGTPVLLSASDASALISQQADDINTVFSGALATRLLKGMSGLVNDEKSDPNSIASPGGSRVLIWDAVDVTGSTATVHATEAQWCQVDQWTDQQGDQHQFRTKMVAGMVDEYVTLTRDASGGWTITQFDQNPTTPI